MPGPNFNLLWPEFLVLILAFLVFSVDFLLPSGRKHLLGWAAALGLLGTLAFTLPFLWRQEGNLYDGVYRVDRYALFFKAAFLLMGAAVALASLDFVKRRLAHPGEYYGIVLFAVAGMMAMASAGELLTAIIALELESFALYVLTSYAREDPKSNEAGVKFILLGAFSSALLLYGLSLLYGALQVTHYQDIAAALQGMGRLEPIVVVGLALMLAGFGFKLAAVPFHMWAPDIYEGAPLPVTAFIAVASKAAVMALLLRFFAQALLPAVEQWRLVIAILAAVTMTAGNLVALAQTNIKRLLAYSSIGQMGYLLAGVAALSTLSSNGLLFHLVGYAVTNMAVFVGVIAFFNATGKDDIPAFAGLASRAPFLAACLTVGLFSLAGLPFFAGFTTKFYLFTAVAQEGFLWLAGLAVVNSVVSLYYYLMIIKQMYIQRGEETAPLRLSPVLSGALAVLAGGVMVIGIYPAPLVTAIEAAVKAVL